MHLLLLGFRHRLRLLHPAWFYLPAPCYGLSDHTILAIMWETHDSVTSLGCTDCDIRNAYLQCPSVMANALFYDEVKLSVLGPFWQECSSLTVAVLLFHCYAIPELCCMLLWIPESVIPNSQTATHSYVWQTKLMSFHDYKPHTHTHTQNEKQEIESCSVQVLSSSLFVWLVQSHTVVSVC